METYYILRLTKDLRISLDKERDRLYSFCGDSSLLEWEPSIILGPVNENLARVIPSPPLPLAISGKARYTNGVLHFPLYNPTALAKTRAVLETSWPIDGIYLGRINLDYSREDFTLTSLSIAVMETSSSLWRISQERRLHSDKYH